MKRFPLIVLPLALASFGALRLSAKDRERATVSLPTMDVTQFYTGQEEKKTTRRVAPVTTEDGWISYRLLEKTIAYRDDRCARARFRVPAPFRGVPARVRLEAYCDDSSYSRCLYLDLDGKGGYLAVASLGGGQFRGEGVLGRETQKWLLPLEKLFCPKDQPRGTATLQVGDPPKSDAIVTLAEVLSADPAAEHTFCSWISTYREYGPGSWVTLAVEFRIEI
jgi:hypothetical protein